MARGKVFLQRKMQESDIAWRLVREKPSALLRLKKKEKIARAAASALS